MEERFVAEPMLGKLAKWLRMIGCDAVYQRSYGKEDLLRLTAQGRRLLTRRADAQTREREQTPFPRLVPV